jgi:flagellar L-ring protein precursor FlgH
MSYKVKAISIVALILIILLPGQVSATSLWSGKPSMFVDQKAKNVGDLVTLIIVETAQASQSAKTSSVADSQVAVGPGGGIISFIPEISLGGGDEYAAGGTVVRKGNLTARMTTKVIEILPNGNIVIEGVQTIKINDEDQIIKVKGTIRPKDIASDNTVLSTFLADAEISYIGAGPINADQKPGLLTRIFNWLF